MIKAVGEELEGVSLGPCKVQVDVAETTAWLPARAILQTEVVEAVVSLALEGLPKSAKVGDSVTLVVRLTHPDSSIDRSFSVYVGGCGAFTPEEGIVNRRMTVNFKVEAESGSQCTVTASTSTNGTIHVVGTPRVEASITIESG
jgi:hypothetical protein